MVPTITPVSQDRRSPSPQVKQQPSSPSPPDTVNASEAAATAAAATSTMHQNNAAGNGASSQANEELACMWQGCTEKCGNAELLYVGYAHLRPYGIWIAKN